MASVPIVSGEEMLDVLRTCCSRGTPATIGSNADLRILAATFSNFSQDSVTLDLQEELGEFRVDCPCYAVFFQEQASHLITTPKLEQPAPFQLVLPVPEQISMERRLSLRVPVDGELHVTVTRGDAVLQAEPKGLSLSGINVRFDPSQEPSLRDGECIKLRLRLEHESIDLQGSVTRRTGKMYSITFSHAASVGDIHPPDQLQRMYWKLREDNLLSQIIKPERASDERTVQDPVPGEERPSV